MADTKIASLTDGLTTSGTDRIPVAISPYGSGNNAYITPSYLKTFMVTGGTVTSSTPVFDMTQTWNSGAVTFSGLKLNITDTASATESLLMDLQVDGSSKFTVRKDGAVSGTTFDLLSGFGGISNSGGPWVASSGKMAFGGNFTGPFLQYDGNNNTLGLRDRTNAQTLNVYNTWSSAGANYERIALFFSSNLARLAVQRGGTGVDRDLLFYVGSQDTWKISASTGSFLAASDNAFDIGASGASRPRNAYVAGIVLAGGAVKASGGLMSTDGAGGAGIAILRGQTSASYNTAEFWLHDLNTAATAIRFGGNSSSNPMLKKSSASMQARLGDDSAFTAIQGKLTTDNAYTATPPTCTGYVTIYDSTGTPYKVMVST